MEVMGRPPDGPEPDGASVPAGGVGPTAPETLPPGRAGGACGRAGVLGRRA
jgi:hypothetical protein